VEAVEKYVAKPLGITVMDAAFSIWNTVCVNMSDAIRTITSWEGIDPREYTFVSGGGAAGLHMIQMASDLGVEELLIPRFAGSLSAVGGLVADMVADFQRNYYTNSDDFDFEGVKGVLESLEEEAVEFLKKNSILPENRRLEFSVDSH